MEHLGNVHDSLNEPKTCEPRCWETPWEFASHAAASLANFLIMAVPAVGLDLLVRSLKTHGVGSGVILFLQTAEYALAGTDLVLLLAFLWQTIIRTIRKL